MSKHLMVNADTDFPQDWPLPDSLDEIQLQASLQQAMERGHVVEVPIQFVSDSNATAGTLLLHGARIASVAIVEFTSDSSDQLEPHFLRVFS